MNHHSLFFGCFVSRAVPDSPVLTAAVCPLGFTLPEMIPTQAPLGHPL